MTINQKIDNWTEQINMISSDFQEQFGKLTKAELNWKPATAVWSVGQNIDHLIVINSTYYPIIENLKKGTNKTPFLSEFGFYNNLMGNFILKSVHPDNRKKIKTFPIWEPAQSDIAADIVSRFMEHQKEFTQKIKECQPFLEKGAIISSPANSNITYTLEKAYEIIIAHESRHFNQAFEVFDTMKRRGH